MTLEKRLKETLRIVSKLEQYNSKERSIYLEAYADGVIYHLAICGKCEEVKGNYKEKLKYLTDELKEETP